MDGLVEIFLFFGVLYYFFNFRANNMVDVLSTRLQEVYAKWESRTEITRNADPTGAPTSDQVPAFRRVRQQFMKKKAQDREQARKLRESSLFKIKETEPLVPSVKQKPSFLRHCCNSCTPSSRDSLVTTITKRYLPFDLNILVVNPGPSLLSKVFSCISHVSSLKEYYYPRVTETVLTDSRLKDAIKLTAWESVSNEGCDEQEALARAKARAKAILQQMESRMSNTLLKITAWLLYKLLPCFINAAVVLPAQLEMIQKASDTGLPLIFLPLHRSHLDYIMLSFILLTNNIRNPLIAAGDNLRIPLFGWLLRGLGAFYIKRRIDPATGRKDVLYRAILHTYIMESLRTGHNMEFFIEGGRTRTGKPCMPKGGILSVIIDAYMDGSVEDALLVPVAMNYERLVDGNFAREQLGQPKKMETFGSTIRAIWSTLMGDYGIVKINFCQPFSLREMLRSFQAQQSKSPGGSSLEKPLKCSMSSSSLYGTDVVVEEHRQLVDSIARHVVYDCSRSTPIMSTNVVAFLLLNRFRSGCTMNKLIEAVESMRQELEWSDADVGFCGETIDVINHAMDILGPDLVERIEWGAVQEHCGTPPEVFTLQSLIAPVLNSPQVIELSYYSNALLMHYIMDSIIVTALYAERKSHLCQFKDLPTPDYFMIYHDSLLEYAFELCNILTYEFIFCKPCQDLEYTIVNTIQNMIQKGIISLEEEGTLEEERWGKRIARDFEDSSDEEYFNECKTRKIKYKVSIDADNTLRMEFLCTALHPLICTYTYSARSLKKLVGRSLSEKDLVELVLKEIKNDMNSTSTEDWECLCVEPIKNSLKLFEKSNILECHSEENVKIFYLKEEYDTEFAVRKIYDTIRFYYCSRW